MHNGIVVSEHDSDSPRHSSPSRPSSEHESESPLEGDLLVVRRLLGQVLQPFDESQRENIFHTRCLIQNNICSLIVDGGSCANVASTRVVDKLGLSTISHTKPYKLQWLSEGAKSLLTNKSSSTSLLVNTKMKSYVMLCQWKLHMFFWEGLGNLIERFFMMALPINFLLTSMDTRSF